MASEQVDIYHTAALEPPDGVKSNFDDPYTLEPYMILTSTICLALGWTAIVARTYTKAFLLKNITHDDYVLVLSGLLFAAFTAVMLVAQKYGQGRHQWNVTLADMQYAIQLVNIVEVLYGPGMLCAKHAVLAQIKRAFANPHRRQTIDWIIQVLIYINFMTWTALPLSFLLACVPREALWDKTVAGRCINTNAALIASASVNVISDILIILVPIAGVARLQLPKKKKIGAGAIFAMGALSNFTTMMRLWYSVRLSQTEDLTWAIEPIGGWALGEFATVILCACLPTFPRLFQHLRRNKKPPKCPHDTATRLPGVGMGHQSRCYGRATRFWDSTDSKEDFVRFDNQDGAIAVQYELRVETHDEEKVMEAVRSK